MSTVDGSGGGRGDDRSISTRRIVGLVAGRELRERLRAKSFWILTALLALIVVGIGVGGRLAGDDGPGPIEVAYAGSAPEDLEPALRAAAAQFDRDVEVRTYDDVSSARDALGRGDADVAVDPTGGDLVFEGGVDQEVTAVVQQAWATVELTSNLADAGLTAEEAADALRTDPLEPVSLEGGDETSGLAIVTGTLAAVLLFISLQTFGGYVLTGVVEEKSTAVVELLLARIRADQLLAGKVLGIGVAALLQFTVGIGAALVALSISGADVPGEIWSAVPMTLVWYLTGYAFYSMLFALAGSLVSRQEDAQAASAPIMTALLAAYMTVFFFGYVPGSTGSRVLSLIPPIAPLLMPMRMASGEATVAEVVAALLLLVLAIVGVWKLTGGIYSEVLLRRGSRISWGVAWSIARGHTS